MQVIHDRTATNDVHLRRTLYLTIMSSAGYEEAGHKLMKMGLQPAQEPELVRMIIDCCSQERTFLRFYALLAQRFCVKFFSYACALLLFALLLASALVILLYSSEAVDECSTASSCRLRTLIVVSAAVPLKLRFMVWLEQRCTTSST